MSNYTEIICKKCGQVVARGYDDHMSTNPCECGSELNDLRTKLALAEAELEEWQAKTMKERMEAAGMERQRNEAQAALKEEKALFASYVEMHNAAKQDWWDERERLKAALKRLREGEVQSTPVWVLKRPNGKYYDFEGEHDDIQDVYFYETEEEILSDLRRCDCGDAYPIKAMITELRALADGEKGE